jgi:hypothetical protein
MVEVRGEVAGLKKARALARRSEDRRYVTARNLASLGMTILGLG